MTTRAVVESVRLAVADHTRDASSRGHAMHWREGDRRYTYAWHGRCAQCGAEMIVRHMSTSCTGIRDARTVPCSGEGTYVLTDIETARAVELTEHAVSNYGRAMREYGA